MRRRTLLIGVSAVAAGLLSVNTTADISATAHNFSSTSWGGGEICKPCHTPHFADPIGYLWAHTLSTATYTLFDGSASSPGGEIELDIYSRMCLSCHDGTVALNDYHNGGGPPVYISAGRNLGIDLSDDHPIGDQAEYPTTGSSRFNAPTQSPSGVWGFGGTFFPEVPLFAHGTADAVVSCSTCHTPHGKAGIDFLLRKSNLASDLCLTCHIK